MSDQPLCERSSRTGVRSTRIGKSAVVRLALEEPGVDPERVLVDLADPEHPAVALAAPDRPADLVGQGLEGDLLVGLRQRAGDRAVGPVAAASPSRNAAIACSNRRSIRSLKPSNGISPVPGRSGGLLDVVAVDRVQEQRGPDPLVEVLATPGGTARAPRRPGASRPGRAAGDQLADRAVAERRVGAGDRLDQERAAVDMVGIRAPGMDDGPDRRIAARRLGVAAVLLDPDDRFEQHGEDPLAVDARPGPGRSGPRRRRT